MKGEEDEHTTLRQCLDSVASIKDCSKNLRALWKSGTSTAPSFVSFVLLEEKQATNCCGCKRSMLELTQCCTTTHTSAHFVSRCQKSKDMILKIVRTPPLPTKCAREQCLFAEVNIEASWQDPEYPWGATFPQRENFMSNTGSTTLLFLTGLGIGAGLAVLFAPQSGEETREWIADTAERKFKVLRRVGRRSFRQLQDVVAEGEEKVTGVLRNGRKALESVAAKLE